MTFWKEGMLQDLSNSALPPFLQRHASLFLRAALLEAYPRRLCPGSLPGWCVHPTAWLHGRSLRQEDYDTLCVADRCAHEMEKQSLAALEP